MGTSLPLEKHLRMLQKLPNEMLYRGEKLSQDRSHLRDPGVGQRGASVEALALAAIAQVVNVDYTRGKMRKKLHLSASLVYVLLM